MPKWFFISKTAVVLINLTVWAIDGITTVILFNYDFSCLTTAKMLPSMRLPKNLLPRSYRVFLQPHLYMQITEEENGISVNHTMLFSGTSIVKFHCVEKAQTIYLHSKDLLITKIPIVMNQGRKMWLKTFTQPEVTSGGLTQYASNIAGSILTFFEGYFGINYKQSKLLCQTWRLQEWKTGLITHQEAILLYDENVSSPLQSI